MKTQILIVATACITSLCGCTTTQTLLAQFGAAPLPNSVKRKLYGTGCENPDWRTQNPSPTPTPEKITQTVIQNLESFENPSQKTLKYTKMGNPYPARWFLWSDIKDPALRSKIMREQNRLTAMDPELALDFGRFLTERAKENQKTSSQSQTGSGYSALGY